MKFTVTFPVGGPLADSYSEIDASDEHAARLALIGVYGRKGWAGVYGPSPATGEMIGKYGLTFVPFGTEWQTAQEYAS